ncbi:Uncharacterised protein [Vibrio cholerae]|nr:Uncharacterised protein [Vibrio cholerae]
MSAPLTYVLPQLSFKQYAPSTIITSQCMGFTLPCASTKRHCAFGDEPITPPDEVHVC